MADSNEKKSFIDTVKTFFKGIKSEFKKIVWPTGETLVKQTAMVVVISAALSVIIRLIDMAAQALVGLVSSI
ncbi:MAG: preprotein translocase subunit SecE [Lachnospiraceae bacterium]|nr:preprotein translocase subunit SecE [Lachnospiraceae bacterium]MBP5254469.1 preprotein translocase subunit SecE [Lachnospiraceae bacterium]